mmetsp:Transcript_34615/g.69950  ORF Transcript_34615/g.69950 Transcript_34615/m.69950 type:complete len:232 (-) Transcript_34615:109-804(-)
MSGATAFAGALPRPPPDVRPQAGASRAMLAPACGGRVAPLWRSLGRRARGPAAPGPRGRPPRAAGRLVVPPPYSARLLRTSWLHVLTAVGAAAHGQWLCAALGAAVLLAGLNYWRHPCAGPRRTTDMAVLALAVSYHLGLVARLWGLPCTGHAGWALTTAPLRPVIPAGPRVPALGPAGYYALFLTFVGIYLRARWLARRGDFGRSSCWHMALHCTGNLGNVLLYPGLPNA